MHDEEPQPGKDEVEFSDDRQEANYKRMLREMFFLLFDFLPPFSSNLSISDVQAPVHCPHAAAPSAWTRMDCEDFDNTSMESSDPNNEHRAYYMNYGVGPSRPPLIPYGDRYVDSFTGIAAEEGGDNSKLFNNIRNSTSQHCLIRPGSIGFVGIY